MMSKWFVVAAIAAVTMQASAFDPTTGDLVRNGDLELVIPGGTFIDERDGDVNLGQHSYFKALFWNMEKTIVGDADNDGDREAIISPGGSMDQELPGVQVRSVTLDAEGQPFAAGATIVMTALDGSTTEISAGGQSGTATYTCECGLVVRMAFVDFAHAINSVRVDDISVSS